MTSGQPVLILFSKYRWKCETAYKLTIFKFSRPAKEPSIYNVPGGRFNHLATQTVKMLKVGKYVAHISTSIPCSFQKQKVILLRPKGSLCLSFSLFLSTKTTATTVRVYMFLYDESACVYVWMLVYWFPDKSLFYVFLLLFFLIFFSLVKERSSRLSMAHPINPWHCFNCIPHRIFKEVKRHAHSCIWFICKPIGWLSSVLYIFYVANEVSSILIN